MSLLVDDIVVNPSEVVPELTEVSFSELGLSITGANFGESVVRGATIKTDRGQVMLSRDPEPRTLGLTLMVRESTEEEVTLAQAVHGLEVIVGALQRRGTWIRRDYHFGDFAGPLLYRISGEVSLSGFAGWQAGESPDVSLTMVADHAGYSTEEVESEEFSTSSDRYLIYELPQSTGTAEGLKRIAVTNEGEEDWNGLLCAGECESAPEDLADPTAQLVYPAAALTLKGGTEVKSGMVEHASLTAGWLTILNSEIAGEGHMTHQGPRRLWVRSEDPGSVMGDVQLRLRWRSLGALRWDEKNAIVPSPVISAFQWLDLGPCRPEPAALGDERWEWEAQARALSGAGKVKLHLVAPLPTEQYALLKTPPVPQAADGQSVKSPGTVEGTGAGQEWENESNAKTSNNLYASVELDEPLGPISSQYLAAKNLGFALPEAATVLGVVPEFEVGASGTTAELVRTGEVFLMKEGAIVGTPQTDPTPWGTTDRYISFGSSSDLFDVSLIPTDVNHPGFGVVISARAVPYAISTIARVDHIRVTVYYTEAQDENRVCFATRSFELRSDRVIRQHPTDDIWADLAPYDSLPYDTPGGPEQRPSRGILIPTQGDFEALADGGTNPFSAKVLTRRAHQFAREAA